MKSEVLAQFHLPFLTCVGLLIFFGFFLSLLYWVMQQSRRPMYEHLAHLPLREE